MSCVEHEPGIFLFFAPMAAKHVLNFFFFVVVFSVTKEIKQFNTRVDMLQLSCDVGRSFCGLILLHCTHSSQ